MVSRDANIHGPMAHPNKSKMARPPSLILKKNINNSVLDKDICTKFHGKMHHGHAEMTTDQKSKPEVNSRDVIKWMSEAYVRRSRWL